MDSLAFGHNLVVPIALSAMPGIRRRSVMTERRLTIDGINGQCRVNPDTIYKWITRKRMPAPKGEDEDFRRGMVADYLAKKLETIRPEEASAARVLREMVKNQRLG